MRITFLISGVILFVTCTVFFFYEIYIFQTTIKQKLTTLGEVIAANSTAALAFDNHDDAYEILTSLKAEPHIVAACLYDKDGKLFCKFPKSLNDNSFPLASKKKGYQFVHSHLEGFEPVLEGTRRLGTLYLKSNLEGMYDRLQLYGIVTLFVIVISFILSYLLSKILQRRISKPILALAETAKTISVNRDYSVRAVKSGDDELGSLTISFNDMLQQIEEQSDTLKGFNEKLEQSEKLFRAMIEKDADMKTLATQDGKVFYASPSLTKILGYENQEFITTPAFDLIHPDDVPGLIEGITDIIQTPGKSLYRQQRLKHKNGTWIWCEGTITNMLHEPAVAALVSNFRDITERKNAEEEIKIMNEELEKRVKERTEELESFSYSVSHDLRAPLRAVNGYARILEEDYSMRLDAEGKRLMSEVQYNAKKMGTLIDDLLAFSRLGKKEIRKTLIDMNELTKAAISEINQTIAYSGELNFGHLHPVMADFALLQHVMINLISNAIKYSSKKEKPVIEIKSTRENGEVIYLVKDNGEGFEMQYAHKLFGVFQRLHTAEEFPGTGVGLAIVQRIIHKHNGRIWAEGKVGTGATFYFALPAANKN